MPSKTIFPLILAAALAVPQLAMGVETGVVHQNLQEPERPGYLKPKEDVFTLPPVVAPPSVVSARSESVPISNIVFRGNAVISSEELGPVVAPYIGKRLNEAQLEELRQKLTRYYIDRGYVNSGALLDSQAITSETLTVDIVEGRLSGVRLRGMERLNDDYLAKRLHAETGSVLNIDRLRERFQIALDDPLFKRMNARLTPGERLGEAYLDIDVERARPYQLTAFANNYRPPSIGATTVGMSGWVRNLTGWGDLLEANIQGADDLHGKRGSLGWKMPLNAAGTQFSLLVDYGRSAVIEEPLRALDIKSTLDNKEVGLGQTLIETLNHKLSIGAQYSRRKNTTTLAGLPFSFVQGEPNGVTKVSAWRFWQEYSYRSEVQVLALRSTFTATSNNLQIINGLPPTPTPQPNQDYGLWLGQAQYARQVMDNGAQLVLRGAVQSSGHTLLALDRMSIGGINTVRGYRENQMVRDTGVVLNFEFDYPLYRNSGSGLNLNLVPFYDYGRGKNRSESAQTLSSAGLALRLRWQGLKFDLAWAKRLQHPDSLTTKGGNLQDKGVHVQLSYDFFR